MKCKRQGFGAVIYPSMVGTYAGRIHGFLSVLPQTEAEDLGGVYVTFDSCATEPMDTVDSVSFRFENEASRTFFDGHLEGLLM